MNLTRYEFKDLGFIVQIDPESLIREKLMSIDFEILYHNPIRESCIGQVFASGWVKWDGCSNWYIQNNGYFHTCTPEELINIGKIFHECWKLASELIPNFSY